MTNNNKYYYKVINKIKTYIFNDKVFTHFNQKYSLDNLLYAIIIICFKGISYNNIIIFINNNNNNILNKLMVNAYNDYRW